MPFKPGQITNPQGRGVEKNDQKRILKNLFSPFIKDAAQEVISMLQSSEFEHKSWAIKLLLEYTCGKPHQGIELADIDGNAIQVTVNLVDKRGG